jgi:uncharacterized protein YuzE
MKVQYFSDSDTLHIVFPEKIPQETRDVDENTLPDFDEICQTLILHAI